MANEIEDYEKETRKLGWRAGHWSRHTLYYEEWIDGEWQRIQIDGEMLTGRPYHAIYFASLEEWKKYPAWAQGRREEIITRIKNVCPEQDYEYDGA